MDALNVLRPSGLGAGEAAGSGADAAREKARETAEEFEAVFLAQVLRGMNANLHGPSVLGEGEDTFADMLQDEYAKLISRSGGVGIADGVMREMLKMQEVA